MGRADGCACLKVPILMHPKAEESSSRLSPKTRFRAELPLDLVPAFEICSLHTISVLLFCRTGLRHPDADFHLK